MSQLVNIVINDFSGEPFQVWLSQECPFIDGQPSNIFIASVTSSSPNPYQFSLPTSYQNLSTFSVYVLGSDGCITCETILQASPTPTPTSTITPSVTPTNTPSTSVDATPSATITLSVTPTNTITPTDLFNF